ncbi:MAG TPA: GNAT family N-acetyltransferase [Dehalococcoidia bacterium]
MTLEILPATLDDAARLGDICFRAFDDVSRRHGFATDFDSPAVAQMIIGQLIRDEDTHSIAAVESGTPVGSNFLMAADDVGAIGPITIDPAVQGRGIGRALMEDALRHAREEGIERVRLMQDAFNMHSLSLYASLGFDTKAAVALLVPSPRNVPEVRPATAGDMDAVERLSTEIYGVSRRREVEAVTAGPFQAFVYEKDGRVVAYFVPGMPGHGVGETEEALALAVLGATSHVAPPFARAFCPLAEGDLFRRFLQSGCRVRKVMNLMAQGPYEEPRGPWMPSVGY